MYVTFRCSLFSILRVPDKTVPESFHIEVNLPSLTQTCPQPTNTCNFPRLCDAIALRFLKDTTAKLGYFINFKVHALSSSVDRSSLHGQYQKMKTKRRSILPLAFHCPGHRLSVNDLKTLAKLNTGHSP